MDFFSNFFGYSNTNEKKKSKSTTKIVETYSTRSLKAPDEMKNYTLVDLTSIKKSNDSLTIQDLSHKFSNRKPLDAAKKAVNLGYQLFGLRELGTRIIRIYKGDFKYVCMNVPDHPLDGSTVKDASVKYIVALNLNDKKNLDSMHSQIKKLVKNKVLFRKPTKSKRTCEIRTKVSPKEKKSINPSDYFKTLSKLSAPRSAKAPSVKAKAPSVKAKAPSAKAPSAKAPSAKAKAPSSAKAPQSPKPKPKVVPKKIQRQDLIKRTRSGRRY